MYSGDIVQKCRGLMSEVQLFSVNWNVSSRKTKRKNPKQLNHLGFLSGGAEHASPQTA
jgi:hypothetical protein